MEEIIEKKEIKLNVNNELEKINSRTIFEFKKTMDNFDLKKIKAYKIKDGERTVSVLFYDNDFFAIDRVNFREGYEYNQDKEFFGISENLNYRIKKIPNVAKTRKILNIEDIETRMIFNYRHIEKKNWEQIAMLMHMGIATVFRKHKQQLKVNHEN